VGINSVHAIGREDRTITSIAPPRPGKKASLIKTCKAETKLIGDYLSDDLDAANRQAFENHLRACPQCAAFLATYKKTIDVTRNYLNFAAAQDQTPKLTLRAPFSPDRCH
jgi:anti-sigma factor RsiW